MAKPAERATIHLLVILAYTVLTLLLTYPLILNFTTHVLGRDDIYLSIWDLWWAKTALWDLHTTPYYTDYVFHPTGVSLALHSLDLCNGIISIPLQMLLNLATTYNLLVIAGFVLSGYGMFLLSKYLTGDGRAAFVSGLIFAFCPYRFAHLLGGQLDVVSIQFIPFYVLYLLKTDKVGGTKNALLAAGFLAATSLCCWHYLVFLSIFTALFIFYRIWFEREKTAAILRRLAAFFVVFGLMIFPFAYPLIADSLSGNYRRVPFEWSVTMSADVVAYLVPSAQHPLLGNSFAAVNSMLMGAGNMYESTVFLGYAVILLSAYYVIREDPLGAWVSARVSLARSLLSKRTKAFGGLFAASLCLLILLSWVFGFDAEFCIILFLYSIFFIIIFYLIKDRQIGFWPLSAIFFFLLSLGPFLHVYGRIYALPLPYAIFPLLPVLSAARDPTRFGLIAIFSLAVIAAYSLKELSGRIIRKDLFFAAVSLIVLFEFLAVPCILADLRPPQFYSELTKDKEDYAILDVPLPRKATLYYQTQHEKRIVGGYIAIHPVGFYIIDQNLPVIPSFLQPVLLSDYAGRLGIKKDGYYRPDPKYDPLLRRYFSSTDPSAISEFGPLYDFVGQPDAVVLLNLSQSYPQGEIVVQNIGEIGKAVLRHYDIRYIIVHENELGAPENAAIRRLVAEILPDSAPFYEGEGMVVYAVPATEPVPFAILGAGWYSKEPLEHVATRWMPADATIETVDWPEGEMSLSFTARSFERERKLVVFLNGKKSGEYPIGLNDTAVRILGLKFAAGNNTISFHSPEGCARQVNEFRTTIEEDVRCVSFAFQNIRITPKEGA